MSSRFFRFTVLVAVLAIGGSSSAYAVEYAEVNPTASKISFTFDQMGARVYGTFSKFEGTLYFDTARPEDAHAMLTIDLASIDVDSEDARTELPKPAWFDTAAYPQAKFESTQFKDLANNRYMITGNLTLRGLTREVEVPVLLKAEGGIAIFVGELTLKRNDFKIGEGEWADSFVSNDINIQFRMVAPQR
ncbi:YceI family protein [Pseudomonas sp. NFX224]|uniref:YceI family protein n=1 Tax=Pseudomonas sp. NFX224 TaxID=3402862 RepID=UPI003AFA989F